MSTVATALIEHEPMQPPAPVAHVSNGAAILQIIDRAARDPKADIDKMERLYAMLDRELTRQAEHSFNEAMKAAQEEMRPISADASNTQTKSKYATYAKLDSALRPIYTKHGFSVSFDEADSPKPDHIRVLAYVANGGFTRTYRKDMPADGKGAKGGDVMTKTHAAGAAASYGMRYLLKGIFNVAVGEDDTDGNSAVKDTSPISEDQLKRLRDLIELSGADIQICCEKWKIDALPDLPATKFDEAYGSLERWHKQQGGR